MLLGVTSLSLNVTGCEATQIPVRLGDCNVTGCNFTVAECDWM
jgi:hypothetical protein